MLSRGNRTSPLRLLMRVDRLINEAKLLANIMGLEIRGRELEDSMIAIVVLLLVHQLREVTIWKTI